jgi:hypothetical protein
VRKTKETIGAVIASDEHSARKESLAKNNLVQDHKNVENAALAIIKRLNQSTNGIVFIDINTLHQLWHLPDNESGNARWQNSRVFQRALELLIGQLVEATIDEDDVLTGTDPETIQAACRDSDTAIFGEDRRGLAELARDIPSDKYLAERAEIEEQRTIYVFLVQQQVAKKIRAMVEADVLPPLDYD